MHNEWTSGAGCFLSWEDRIKEGGGIRGRQLNDDVAKSPSSPARALSGHNPSPSVSRFLIWSIQHSFRTASFNFKGNDKWRTSPLKVLESQHRGVNAAQGEINLRFFLKIHLASLSRTIMNFVGYNSFTNHNDLPLSHGCMQCFVQSTPIWL